MDTENEGRQFNKFVVNMAAPLSCRNDRLRYNQQWKNCQVDYLLFPVGG